MTAFDSIVNVEEWISDHYLASDEGKDDFLKRTKERIKVFKESTDSPIDQLTTRRQDLLKTLTTLDTTNPDEVAKANEDLALTFGYGVPTAHTTTRSGEVIETHAWTSKGVALIFSEAIDSPEDFATVQPTFTTTIVGKEQALTTSKLVSTLFLADNPPQFVVVVAGPWMVLCERESFPLGRMLAVNVGLALERGDTKAGGELQHVTVMLTRLDTEESADGTTWWLDTLEDSHNHAVKVSESLRGAIKESIEIIGNDVLNRYRDQGLDVSLIDGNELSRQALRYLYRILFLLFAEASPETEILPVGDPDYNEGYGLSRLRNTVLSEPVSQRAQNGTHLYESLNVLFRLVNNGHDGTPTADQEAFAEGLTFHNMSADLFQDKATALIDRSKLSNIALHRVLTHLLLSPEKNGKDRGFVSYATLGVTELGQVYEGLMSYTGFIAETRLNEVAPHGDPSKGSWVVPTTNTDDLPSDCFVMTTKDGQSTRVVHELGSFVYRQSSRDRERSASFYSPQVITEFAVSQALEVLEEQGRLKTSDDVLALKICEPAMGSGAFAVETVRQLGEKYLELRERELGETVAPEDRPAQLQRVKAHIALHQVYGVDLNDTAVELAEISLWLSTMTAGLQAPWFGLHLRRGNSLVGSLRSTYDVKDLKKRAWLTTVPHRESMEAMSQALDEGHVDAHAVGRIHQFLLPSNGFGAAADAKDLKDIAGDEQKQMKTWRKEMTATISPAETKRIQSLARRTEELWQFALVRMRLAEQQSAREIEFFGHPTHSERRGVTREEIERDLLRNDDGSYQRLRLVMDIWNAFWFWPLDKVTDLPARDEWLHALEDILGLTSKKDAKLDPRQRSLATSMEWDDLTVAENANWQFSGAKAMAEVMTAHPWLHTVRDVAKTQGFFHWDLDFAPVFAQGGFDLQVGNPPWVRPRTDVDALLAESDPWFSVASKPTQAEKRQRKEKVLASDAALVIFNQGIAESVVTAKVLGDTTQYPLLRGQQPDLYRGFIERTWANQANNGVVSLVHLASHLTEKKAAPLRHETYLRASRFWQFVNELMLYEIDHHNSYSIVIYRAKKNFPDFLLAASLYRPQTVSESLSHNGDGQIPGFRDNHDNWDLRPHKDRILHVDDKQLGLWHSILEDDSVALYDTRAVFTVNTEAARVLETLSQAPRLKTLGLQFSSGWHESGDKKKGYFDISWQHPDSWSNVILQGPHLGVATPMIKQPNPTMKHNQDWTEIDLEAMPADFIPATAYAPDREAKPRYDDDYGTWLIHDEPVLVNSTYRVAWRRMAATTGFRTLYPALIPPGAQHVNPIISSGGGQLGEVVLFGGYASSLLSDFVVRAAGTELWPSLIERLAVNPTSKYRSQIQENYLRLNCLTEAYAPLWDEIMDVPWTPEVPLRVAYERRQAQNQIDAMVALSLGISVDDLCMIYRTQFPVMRKYDRTALFDKAGRQVPNEVFKLYNKKGEALTAEERTWRHPQSGVEYTYEFPFVNPDREEELRAEYARFEEMM